jgi:hypothetical protein
LFYAAYIERWNCLDRNQAQQRYGKILSEYLKSNPTLYNGIHVEYKTWTTSANYLRCWKDRLDDIMLVKVDLGSKELLSDTTGHQIKSLRSHHAETSSQAGPSTRSQTVSSSSSDSSSSNGSPPTSRDSPTSSGAGPNETIQVTRLSHHHLSQIKKR